MAESDDFYINLTSTDSLEVFPNNKANSFTNLLVRELMFYDISSYEVGLTEISYISSFYNIDEISNFSLFDFEFAWPKSKYGRIYDAKLTQGYFSKPEDLCASLNEKVEQMGISRLKGIKLFSYDHHTRKFSLNVDKLYITLIFHGQIINILGLGTEHYTKSDFAFIGKEKQGKFYMKDGVKHFYYRPDIEWHSDSPHGGEVSFVCQMVIHSSFFVYCDIIREHIFGSNYTNLLRQVPIRGDYQGSRSVQSFQSPFYLPIRSSNIRSINVEIFTVSGDPLDFLEGSVSLVLHFRRKRRSN